MSFRVTCCAVAALTLATPALADCTLWEHRDFVGAQWWLDDGEVMQMIDDPSCTEDDGEVICTSVSHGQDWTIYEASWNDAVSSFEVGAGCEIFLWEHVNQGGARFRTYRSYSYVGDDWNDQVSEVLCTCE